MTQKTRTVSLVWFVLFCSVLPGIGNADKHTLGKEGEWAAYGGDPGGMRHSHLTQINADNVSQLKVGWTYRTGELQRYEGTSAAQRAAFEATPIMVDGTLYFSTPSNRVIALDATNGNERWVYDPKVDLSKGYSEITSRGVSTWLDADLTPAQPGRRRIFVATIAGWRTSDTDDLPENGRWKAIRCYRSRRAWAQS